MNKRSVCALGMAFVLAGCSAGGSGSGKEQTLTVGLFTEMNGDFSPMYYQSVAFAPWCNSLCKAWLQVTDLLNL